MQGSVALLVEEIAVGPVVYQVLNGHWLAIGTGPVQGTLPTDVSVPYSGALLITPTRMQGSFHK